jgi:polyhydroxyalkanoate synthesis regulator phasin
VAVAPAETPVEAAPVEPVIEAEAPETEKAVAPVIESEGVGDMTREQLAAFVVDIVNQVNGKAAPSKKEADNEQALADALEMVKGLSTRVQAAEKSAETLQQALQELTDARPVGIKQMQSLRPTAQAENITPTAPQGPHMDESFVSFIQGGK